MFGKNFPYLQIGVGSTPVTERPRESDEILINKPIKEVRFDKDPSSAGKLGHLPQENLHNSVG